ncbi:MAG TPA: hypothetical protein PLC65_12425 [Bacteroidia bacterium]|nr:hypothetical protein [Bacteroidia bacterium]
MNLKSIALVLSGLAIIVACNSTKKSTTSTAVAPATPTTPSTPAVASKPANGVYAPGEVELTAVKTKFPDATIEILKEGYAIYAQGPCTNCHKPKTFMTEVMCTGNRSLIIWQRKPVLVLHRKMLFLNM